MGSGRFPREGSDTVWKGCVDIGVESAWCLLTIEFNKLLTQFNSNFKIFSVFLPNFANFLPVMSEVLKKSGDSLTQFIPPWPRLCGGYPGSCVRNKPNPSPAEGKAQPFPGIETRARQAWNRTASDHFIEANRLESRSAVDGGSNLPAGRIDPLLLELVLRRTIGLVEDAEFSGEGNEASW